MVVELLTKWYTVAAIATVTYLVIRGIHYQRLLVTKKAYPPKVVVTDHLGGFYTAFGVRKKLGQLVFELKKWIETDPTVLTVLVKFAGKDLVLTKDPENFKALFASQFEDFYLRDRHRAFGPFLGNSVFTMDGIGWKNTRALLRPQFAKEQVAHVQALEPYVKQFLKRIHAKEGAPFELLPMFVLLTQDTALEFLFGDSFKSLWDDEEGGKPEDFKLFRQSFNQSLLTAMAISTLRGLLPLVDWAVYPGRYKKACDIIKDFTMMHVEEALALTPEELENVSSDKYNILYELVKVTRDPLVIRDQLLSMLIAGKDTTMSTLSFVWYELARNPHVYEKLKEEVAVHFGRKLEARVEDITFDSLKRCEYLRAVVNENMRLWPVVPTNARACARDTTLPHGGGPDGQQPMLVCKDQTVIISTFAAQRDKAVFGKDADEYRPERWFDPQLRKIAWGFVPFGGGPRICLGQQFALTEVLYVTVRMVQEFDLVENLDTQYPPNVMAHMGMYLKDLCKVSIK